MASETEGTIRGWGCTPTGEVPSAAVTSVDQNEPSGCLPARLVRGWQRTTLYVILGVLMIIIFINLALTLWIIATLRLSINSIGPIKIVKGGIQLEGQAYVADHLVTSSITSRVGQPITMNSYRNFSIQVVDPEERNYGKLFIKKDAIKCFGKAFEVTDIGGGTIFRASRDEVTIKADNLAMNGEGGISVRSGVQVPTIRAPPGFDLELESQTRSLDLRAPQSILVESRAGSIDINSHKNIKLDSIAGAIKMDAPNIILSNLKLGVPTNKVQRNSRGVKQRVYQMCACASGKLFLATPDTLCAAHVDDKELCR